MDLVVKVKAVDEVMNAEASFMKKSCASVKLSC